MAWDFNYLLGWIGKEKKKGFDDFHLWALSFSRPLEGKLRFMTQADFINKVIAKGCPVKGWIELELGARYEL